MPSKTEKARRQTIKKSIKANELNEIMKALPISLQQLESLFEYVEGELAAAACDNTLQFTKEFIEIHKFDEEQLVEWLEQNSGYCDCEVLMNVDGVVNDK